MPNPAPRRRRRFGSWALSHAVSLNLARKDTGADSVARLLGQATGIWFPGGDQNRLTAAILGTAVLDSIRSRYRHGAVVGGTSAGAAVMSDPMISGDERRPGGSRPPSDSSDGWMTIDRDDVVLVPGFGLLPNVTVDQHFLRRRRHNRLISVVLEHPDRRGDRNRRIHGARRLAAGTVGGDRRVAGDDLRRPPRDRHPAGKDVRRVGDSDARGAGRRYVRSRDGNGDGAGNRE